MSLTDPMATAPAFAEDPDDALDAPAFQAAFEAMGGAQALALWAEANPAEFFTLFARSLGRAAPAPPVWAQVTNIPVDPALTEEEWIQSVQALRTSQEQG
jgi:hypothetical protein